MLGERGDVVAIAGDGALLMTGLELLTAAARGPLAPRREPSACSRSTR